MSDLLNFTPVQLDALREVSSISAGSASTALAQFVDKKVSMRPPEIVAIDNINKHFFPYDDNSFAFIMHSDISGGLKGRIIFVCLYEYALSLCNILLGKRCDLENESPDGIGASSLKEIGMVMFGSYTKAIGDMINKLLLIITPQLWIGGAGNAKDYISNAILKLSGKTLCSHSYLWIGEESSKPLHLAFVPDAEYIMPLLGALGI